MHPNIVRYAELNQLKIGRRLGFGIHGSVFQATYPNGAIVAIKHHIEEDPFVREFEVYARLHEYAVKEVFGFVVPRLLNVDEGLRILEITIVTRPFILDFGGAYLDVKPSFTPEMGGMGGEAARGIWRTLADRAADSRCVRGNGHLHH